MKIGLLSDTHGFLDDRILDLLRDRDEIWHAGDFGTLEVAAGLGQLASLRGVYGNVDGLEIRKTYPENLVWVINGLKILMTHIGGYPGRYNSRTKSLIRENQPGLVVCGHSHILKVMPDQEFKHLHLNPGAAGHHGFHKVRTLLRFEIEGGKVVNLEAVELGGRGVILREDANFD